MKFSRYIIIVLLGLMATTVVAAPQPPRWEPASSTAIVTADTPDGIVIEVKDYYIYVTLQRPASVRLYTILGQPVAQANLQAGTSRIRVSDRGIYILKTGTSTRRVNV